MSEATIQELLQGMAYRCDQADKTLAVMEKMCEELVKAVDRIKELERRLDARDFYLSVNAPAKPTVRT